MKQYKEVKENLVDISRLSYSKKLFAGTSGNLSMYDRENDVMIITPSSIPYEIMDVDDIMLMRLDGEILEGKNRPSSEWRMHAAIYKERPTVNAVIHTHSPYATSFAVNGETIPIILIEMIPFIGGAIPVAKFALPGTEDVGLEALKVLDESSVCLLANHGVLAIGDSLEQAHIRTIYAEDAAKIYSLAKSNGPINLVPEEFVTIMKDRIRRK
jgi:L-ribulose-5-phosphate 4-epimerase